MKKNNMKLNTKKIDKAILEIQKLKIKYARVDTMIVYHALDKALKKLGWDYANLLASGSFLKKDEYAKKIEKYSK